MAQLLAPYNNAMRLGQGFNSYTHQICLHDAVEVPAPKPVAGSTPGPTPDSSQTSSQMIPRHHDEEYDDDTPQNVTYYTRFVEKISDVVDSMNISAALSISTNTIGGQASGSYIDSDKFKQSDINYFVQVKVSNQKKVDLNFSKLNVVNPALAGSSAGNTQSRRAVAAEQEHEQGSDVPSDPSNTEIQRRGTGALNANNAVAPKDERPLDATKFSEIYGDAFISGWEEGGELNALISIKVKNKAKVHHIKAKIEGHLGTPALTGKVSGEVDIQKDEAESETETTISVSWSGGGQIKDRDVLWDVNSLTLAAVNFPDQVRKTPQKIYAILTKYTSLPDFQNRMRSFSPLDYDLASTYTNALLDAYTDYKALWKSLQITSSDLEARRCRVEVATVAQETKEFLSRYAEALSAAWSSHKDNIRDKGTKDTPKLSATVALLGLPDPNGDDDIDLNDPKAIGKVMERFEGLSEQAKLELFKPYPASLIGLQAAKIDCRLQMVRIVQEVDKLKIDPSIALRPDAGDLLPPALFRQLLPVVLGPPDLESEWSDALGTGSIANKLSTVNFEKFPEAGASVIQFGNRANRLRMSKWAGFAAPDSKNDYKNDVPNLNQGKTAKSLTIWSDTNFIKGLVIEYSDGSRAEHGYISDNNLIKTPIQWGDRTVLGVQIGMHGDRKIGHIAINWSDLQVEKVTCPRLKGLSRDDLVVYSTRPAQAGVAERIWDLAGFYSSYNRDRKELDALGVVWAAEPPKLPQSIIPPGIDFASWPGGLRKTMDNYLGLGRSFRVSTFAGSPDWGHLDGHNAMAELERVPDAKLEKLDFWYVDFNSGPTIAVFRATYQGNKIAPQFFGKDPAAADKDKPHLTLDLKVPGGLSRLTAAELATGKTPKGIPLLKSINFRVSTDTNNQHSYRWYLTSNKATKPLIDGSEHPFAGPPVMTLPPEGGHWSIRGFYGQWGDIIDGLGVIWGKDD